MLAGLPVTYPQSAQNSLDILAARMSVPNKPATDDNTRAPKSTPTMDLSHLSDFPGPPQAICLSASRRLRSDSSGCALTKASTQAGSVLEYSRNAQPMPLRRKNSDSPMDGRIASVSSLVCQAYRS